MTKFLYILKELFRNIFRNLATTLTALFSMMLLLLLLDLFWIGLGTTDKFYGELLTELNMELYISEAASDSTVTEIKDMLSANTAISSITYISKDLARSQLSDLIGVDLLVGYDSLNPLPRSFVLSFNDQHLNMEYLNSFEQELLANKNITEVFFNKNWLVKAESTRLIILNLGLVLGIVVLLTVLFNFANNMRLTARTRATGLNQMRLLGAGKFMLALPYLLEGIIIGALSAGLGWFIIYYWKDKINFTMFEIVYPEINHILIFCGVSALLGFLSGYMGIRKLLKI